jgi:hypothetical protein
LQTLEGHQSMVSGVSISGDGQLIVSGSWDKTVKVWSMATGECLWTLEGHHSYVTSVSISGDGKVIVSGSWDKTVKVWSMATGEYLQTLEGHHSYVTSVSISGDGQVIVSGSRDKTVKVWSMATGECLQTLEGHQSDVAQQSDVASVLISGDGMCIVSGSYDKTVKVWSMATGECLRTLEGHQSYVTSVSISGDGQVIVSGSWDKTVKVWSIYQPENSVAFCSLPWIVGQFSAHKGSKTLLQPLLRSDPWACLSLIVRDDRESLSTFLTRLIDLQAPDSLIEAFFEVWQPPTWQNLFRPNDQAGVAKFPNALELLIESSEEKVLERVLKQIIHGFDQHNRVRMGEITLSASSWRLTPALTASRQLTESTCRLLERFPDLGGRFLLNMGSVKTFAEVDAISLEEWISAGDETVIPMLGRLPRDCGFRVASSDRLIPNPGQSKWPFDGKWGDSLNMKVFLQPFSPSLSLMNRP